MQCKMIIQDEVNVQFEGLDPVTLRGISSKFKFLIPGARYIPAVRKGRWDGKITFFDVSGKTYVHMLEEAIPLVEEAGYAIEEVDLRLRELELQFTAVDEKMFGDRKWPKGHTAQGQEVVLRDYQVEAINHFLTNPQCIQEITTGAGKTLICAALCTKCEHYGRTLTMVPTVSLVKQTEAEYRNLGLDVGVYRSGTDMAKNQRGHKHSIATWQTLNSFRKNDIKQGKAAYDLLDEFKDVGALIVDEVHTAKNKFGVLKELLTDTVLRNIPIRWGLSGTVPPEDAFWMTILCTIGKLTNRLQANELQKRGVLAKIFINVLQLRDTDHIGNTVKFADYREENNFLIENEGRLEWVANMAKTVAENDGNTLLLVNRIASGKLMESLIPGSIFISGAMEADDRKKYFDKIDEENNKTIIATYQVASTGINLPRIFNLICLEPGKSYIQVLQSIGRSIRVARDRDTANVWDVCSTCQYSRRHLNTRIGYYKKEQHPYEIHQIDWRTYE